MLLGVRESYLFTRNLYGILVHPFLTIGRMVREKDRSQEMLIFGLPVYLWIFWVFVLLVSRLFIFGRLQFGFFAQASFMASTLLTAYSLLLIACCFYTVWKKGRRREWTFRRSEGKLLMAPRVFVPRLFWKSPTRELLLNGTDGFGGLLIRSIWKGFLMNKLGKQEDKFFLAPRVRKDFEILLFGDKIRKTDYDCYLARLLTCFLVICFQARYQASKITTFQVTKKLLNFDKENGFR